MPRPFTYCPRCATALVDRQLAEDDRPRRVCPADGCRFVQ